MFESNQLNILRHRFSRLHLQQPGLGNSLGRSTHCPGRIETQTRSHYIDRYSKNHREEQVASWPHAGVVHANLFYLRTIYFYPEEAISKRDCTAVTPYRLGITGSAALRLKADSPTTRSPLTKRLDVLPPRPRFGLTPADHSL